MKSIVQKPGHDFDVHVENYIKAIWNISQNNTEKQLGVRNSDLASYLKIRRSSVSNMVDKLIKQKLVSRDEITRELKLTKTGTQKALYLIRKHRLVETFLFKTLKLNPIDLHQEAELLEHAVSPRLLDFIDEFLDKPLSDPHGMPIPQETETAFNDSSLSTTHTLNELRVGSKAIILAIADYNPEFFSKLSKLGLEKQSQIEVIKKTEDSYLEVLIEKNRKISLPQNEAQLIRVKETEH